MRAAVVGSGGIAKIHARLIRELGGEVVAVCGRTLASAGALECGTPYENLSAMLRAETPEVVHVCTPNALHAEQAIAALDAGAHVVCEKPLATSRDEALGMMEAAERAERIGAVAYTYRGYPLVQELRQAVRSGHFGTLRRVSGEYLSQDTFDAAKYQWHFTPGMAGPSYALLDFGVHWLDLVEHVTGQPIVEIFAQLSTHQSRRVWRGGPGQGVRPAGARQPDGGVAVDFGLDDQADVLIRLEGGAAGGATITALSAGNPNHIVLSVDGSAGGFDWCQESPDVYVERADGEKTIRHRDPERLPDDLGWMSAAPAGHPEGYLDAFRNVIRAAWSAMRGEPVDFPSFADGYRGVTLVEAALESARRRRPVATQE